MGVVRLVDDNAFPGARASQTTVSQILNRDDRGHQGY